jgi:glycosyltransferase involved in cell wall biosynthesis
VSATSGRSGPDERPVVLVLSGYFREGFETGPTQSLLGMVRALSDRFRFRVIAEAVEGDVPGQWSSAYGVDRLPLRRGRFGPIGLRRAMRETPHQLVMAVSFFDYRFTILPLALHRLRLVPKSPMLLSPRGEFSAGALSKGRLKKRVYVALAKAAGLLRGVALLATTEMEARDIRSRLRPSGPIYLSSNIRTVPPLPPHPPRKPGEPLRIAFLSRIDRMKNLLFAFDVLAESGVEAEFHIFGGVFHEDYWQRCLARIERMPAHVKVVAHGSIPQAKVIETLARQDLFFLPTLGENFSHAIAEALLSGTPVLISDQTPWRRLAERGAGWDLPLSDPGAFVDAVRRFDALSASEVQRLREGARAEAERVLDPEASARRLEQCLEEVIAGGPSSLRGDARCSSRPPVAVDGEAPRI